MTAFLVMVTGRGAGSSLPVWNRPACGPKLLMNRPVVIEPLVVDPVIHAAEIVRFQTKIVEGPGEYCAIWTGAIGDDGYGRFSITRQGLHQPEQDLPALLGQSQVGALQLPD